MRTARLRRCAPDLLLIPQRGKVLRLCRRVARGAPAARAVAVATHQSEGLVRVRGEVEIHTSPLPFRGRYRSINPGREGRPNADVERGESTRSSCGCRRCPNCSRRSPCQRPPAWSLAPATHEHLGPDTAIRVCLTQRPPSGFQPPALETAGAMRRSGVPRVGLPPPCASSGPHIFPL